MSVIWAMVVGKCIYWPVRRSNASSTWVNIWLSEGCDIPTADAITVWNDPNANICNVARSLTTDGMECDRRVGGLMSSLISLSNCSIAWLVNLYRLIISGSLNWKSVIRVEKIISARCLCLCLRLALTTAAMSDIAWKFPDSIKTRFLVKAPFFMRPIIIPQIGDALSPGSFSKYHGIHH